jgi:hypothetical protein
VSAPAPPGRTVAELNEERDFLLRSIADLEREHAAGDVDDTDFATLRAGYVERAAATLRAIASAADEVPLPGHVDTSDVETNAARPGPPGTGLSAARRLRRFLGRRGVRRWLIALGLCCVLGLMAVVAAHAAGVRLPGESASGSVSLTSSAQVRQELDQASVLASEGKLQSAIAVYDTVLTAVPHQAEALAYKGWFVRLAGLSAHSKVAVADGDVTLAEAARVAPSYALARVFYGIALLDDEADGSGALVQFRAFLADKPSSTLLDSVGTQLASAFTAEHASVPSALRKFEK